DPTSWFFNEDIGYKAVYSSFRQQQAVSFIEDITKYDDRFKPKHGETTICLGVPTFARRGARYFRSTIGSLLHNLDPVERRRIYLMPFVTHTNPLNHPAFKEPWLEKVSDRVLTYNQTEEGFEHIEELEEKLAFREKALLDYIHLLQACQNTGTDYTVILEDDVIAMDGWFHRTVHALEWLQTTSPNFLYLRLFFTEEFLGWNSENWKTYLLASLLTVLLVCVTQLYARKRSTLAQRHLDTRFILSITLLYTPLCILLFFASGTGLVRKWRYPSVVNPMPAYGCCGQGFVFSRHMAEKLIPYYRDKKLGFVDVLTEEYGDAHPENVRYALMPSVLQHVGATTSKEGVDDKPDPMEKHVRTISEKMWNFEFERYNPVVLKGEHEVALR
ncbi:hypothetical protein BDZ85DRAFT_172279, partial [Elsinoe ampelina]